MKAQLKILVLFFFSIFFFSSCLGTKKITENTSDRKQSDITNQQKDSSNVSKTNQEIKDKVITPVASSGETDFDKEVDRRVDQILSRMNTEKSSGSNQYRQYYDQQTRKLITEFFIAQTENQKVNVNESKASEKTLEERTDTYIKKKITALPWWLYVVVII